MHFIALGSHVCTLRYALFPKSENCLHRVSKRKVCYVVFVLIIFGGWQICVNTLLDCIWSVQSRVHLQSTHQPTAPPPPVKGLLYRVTECLSIRLNWDQGGLGPPNHSPASECVSLPRTQGGGSLTCMPGRGGGTVKAAKLKFSDEKTGVFFIDF